MGVVSNNRKLAGLRATGSFWTEAEDSDIQ